MTPAVVRRSSPITGARITILGVLWLTAVFLAASSLGLYYETLAAWYAVPILGLTYAYCLSHLRRETVVLAVVATVVAILVVGFALVFPKGSAA